MNRKNHPPVAPQKIRLPGTTQFRLEQRFQLPAERAQSIVAGNHHPFRFRARPARIPGDDLADKPLVNFRSRHGLFRRKTGMIKKLPRRAHHHKATMVIGRRRIGTEGSHGARHRVEMVLPHQFVRKREGVALKLERADRLPGRRRHFIRTVIINIRKSQTGSAARAMFPPCF